ncbi:MAG: 4-vinyl reductase [Candidatus Micrarchaeaceae archaeon]
MKESALQRKKAARPKRHASIKRKEKAATPASFELLLISRIINVRENAQIRGAFSLQDLIYNFTEETKRYAYKSGLAIGELAAAHFPGVSSLERILASAGMGNILYAPFETEVKITSARAHNTSIKINTNAHYFESGIIAGFLSKETGRHIDARETHCIFNGSDFCQFEASSSVSPFANISSVSSLEIATKLLAEAVRNNQQSNEDYFALSFLPLLREPLLSSATNLVYILGKRIAHEMQNENEAFALLANYIHLSRIRSTKGENEIELQYPHSLSSDGFLQISSALLRGYLSSAHKSACSAERHMSAGAYRVLFKF